MRDRAADGLRGWAATNVMLCHHVAAFWPLLLMDNYPAMAMPSAEPDAVSWMLSLPPFTLAYNGAFAVMIFFVLSGYVVTTPMMRDEGPKLLARFWARPVRLGIPVTGASIIAYGILTFAPHATLTAAELSGSQWLTNFWIDPITLPEAIRVILWDGVMRGDGRLIAPVWTVTMELIGSFIVLGTALLAPRKLQVFCFFFVGLLIYSIYWELWPFYVAFVAGALVNHMPNKRSAVELWLLAIVGFILALSKAIVGSIHFCRRPNLSVWSRRITTI